MWAKVKGPEGDQKVQENHQPGHQEAAFFKADSRDEQVSVEYFGNGMRWRAWASTISALQEAAEAYLLRTTNCVESTEGGRPSCPKTSGRAHRRTNRLQSAMNAATNTLNK